MQKYRWSGILKDGTSCNGIIEAYSYDHAHDLLFQQGIATLDCKKTTASFFEQFRTPRIKNKHLLPFFEHMTILLKSGISLLASLTIVAKQISIKPLKSTIITMHQTIAQGNSLSQAMLEYPTIFSHFMVQAIDAGERASTINLVFENISHYLKKRIILDKKIKQAAFLPLFTLGFAACIFIIIFAFIIPQFSSIFATLQKPLPNVTKTVLAISAWFTLQNMLISLGILVMLTLGAQWFFSIPMVRYYKDSMLTRSLFIGPLMVNSNLIRFFQTLSMFLKAGIPLATALEQASFTVHNTLLKTHMINVKQAILQGKSLEQTLTQDTIIPPEITALISVGEKTGQLDLMLDKSCEFLQGKLEEQLEIMTTIIQPALLILVGIIIAGLMLAVYLPIFSMASLL